MKSKEQKPIVESDDQAASRKEDHISLAFESATNSHQDARFHYEPILSGHHLPQLDLSCQIAGQTMHYPIWVSSMTGGTARANTINHNLAKLCGTYGLGMGLGSCRQLLYDDKRLSEFDVKYLMPDSPLMINLGIAQVEELISKGDEQLIKQLIDKLKADGLIIHINPLQEWMQPEGDRILNPPIDTIKKVLDKASYPIMVKEVGQGFGPASIKALLALPIAALDLAGYGGTNFSKLELLRSDQLRYDSLEPVFSLGHSCAEMIGYINQLVYDQSFVINCKRIIISGGIKGFLDGYYHMQKCQMPAIYAQASGFLKHAMDYEKLTQYLELQLEGLKMSHALLRIK